jgi:hypothetical protein
VLDKLDRTMPGGVEVKMTVARNRFPTGPAGADALYGQVAYVYQGRAASSSSTSAEEVLALVYGLAGIPPASPENAGDNYPGYPLAVADLGLGSLWFYVVLPLTVAVVWFWQHRRRPSISWITIMEKR